MRLVGEREKLVPFGGVPNTERVARHRRVSARKITWRSRRGPRTLARWNGAPRCRRFGGSRFGQRSGAAATCIASGLGVVYISRSTFERAAKQGSATRPGIGSGAVQEIDAMWTLASYVEQQFTGFGCWAMYCGTVIAVSLYPLTNRVRVRSGTAPLPAYDVDRRLSHQR